jgi:hypothetical protein
MSINHTNTGAFFMSNHTVAQPRRVSRSLFRTSGLVAVLTLGTFFIQQANAGCGKYDAPKAAMALPGASFSGSAHFTHASYLQIADVDGYSEDGAVHKAPIVGLWSFKYTAEGNVGKNMPPDGTVVDGGNSLWFADGNELTVSAMRAPDTGSTCLGVWKRTGEWTYDLNHIGQSWDAVHNVHLGPAFIHQYVTLEPGNDKYTGAFFITQYGADGKTVLAKLKGLITATRITVETNN